MKTMNLKPTKQAFAVAVALAASFAAAHTAAADSVSRANPIRGDADLCYWQTVLAGRGADPDELSTAPCDRALRHIPMRQNDRSIVLHNRALVELAKGDSAAARASLERAVANSRKIDMRNLALAQLAHRQGDYALAIRQYELLINAADIAPELAEHRAAIASNRALAIKALEEQGEAEEFAMTAAQ